ncbi:hypothetical protein B0H11DRAFT_1713905, partial [Mycena galericulata]
FHGYQRYDSVLFDTDSFALHATKQAEIRRCAAVCIEYSGRARWKPKTAWAGFQVCDEVNDYSLLLMDFVIRGALLTPAACPLVHFLVDTVDPDMFLRADKDEAENPLFSSLELPDVIATYHG